MKLNALAFGLAFGILWAVAMFLMTLCAMWWGCGREFILLMASFYGGLTVSWGGAFIGLIWGFVDGFICLWIFALLYNAFVKTPRPS
ncbi:MAG: hypothetical protein A2Y63_06270 [Candidatus Riflebacteria bacterium RBG_13_59_9]|nr:MAG: hypothetical protein A2Y63_06270 [Candidatus Riflebacteria bacterium RBG_13_59_9]